MSYSYWSRRGTSESLYSRLINSSLPNSLTPLCVIRKLIRKLIEGITLEYDCVVRGNEEGLQLRYITVDEFL